MWDLSSLSTSGIRCRRKKVVGELRIFLFLRELGVYVSVCVCIRTHTNCTDGVLGCEPRGRKRHLEGLKNPDGLNLGICVFVYVYKSRPARTSRGWCVDPCSTSEAYFARAQVLPLYACMLGFCLHSGDHRAHST